MPNALRAVALAVLLTIGFAATASAVQIFTLHDHPNGAVQPPTYGFRIDDLLGPGVYTFSFDYVDVTGMALVTLKYDAANGIVTIAGRAYGGKDIGGAWDAAEQGWIGFVFVYVDNVAEQDDCAGAVGNDVYVTGESASNKGTFVLDGWGGNQVFEFSDKAGSDGCTFVFDNDTDSKGNATIAGDPSIWSGSGWVKPPTDGARDWLFIAESTAVPTEQSTWGRVKSFFGDK